MTAPLGSITVPVIEPRSDCAKSADAQKRKNARYLYDLHVFTRSISPPGYLLRLKFGPIPYRCQMGVKHRCSMRLETGVAQ